MANDLLLFDQQADQLLAGVKDNQAMAIREAVDLIVTVATNRKRRFVLAMLRAVIKEARREEERKRDGK